MTRNRNKLYLILLAACSAGYAWLYISSTFFFAKEKSLTVCLFKSTTSMPCPSCGTTRSLISIIKGNFFDALILNPFGYLMGSALMIIPIWILKDAIRNSNSLFDFYLKMELRLSQPIYAVPSVLLVLINWIWNISKGI
jgi:hypothetical protein